MTNKQAVHKLFMLLKDYKKVISMIISCLLISTGLNLCIPLLSRQIMDDGFIGGNRELLIESVLYSLVIYIVICVINIIKEKKRIDISAKIQYSLSEESFSHLLRMNACYFSNKNYAEILNNVNTDIGNMASIADESMFFVVTQAFSMVGGVIGLFILDYRMTILVLLFIPVKYLIMKYFAKKRKKIVDEYIIDRQKYAGWFGDTIGGIKEVKLFGIMDNKHIEFSKKMNKVIQDQKNVNILGQWNIIADSVLVRLLTTLIYIGGSDLVFNLQLSVGSVFAFITYSAYVTGPISSILNIGYLLSGIIPSVKRYYEFMEMQEEKDYNELNNPTFGDLKIKDVSFSYDIDNPILVDINIEFPKGSKTALIGKNGSGKTTIIELITRMYEPVVGQILLNETDIYDISLLKYRNMISVVSQQIYLFNDTIRNNIRLYKQVEDKEIEKACKDSGLTNFIDEVSLDYVVGQNGVMLSGGQKQKIALARALIHDKPFIIFDEATSNTDIYSETQINGLLKTRLKQKTVIIITHRKEVLSEVDQIVFVKDGMIAETGNYNELLIKSEDFRLMLKASKNTMTDNRF